MANALCQDTLDQVRNIFMVSGSIRQTVKVTGVSRNAVRSYLRQEGIAFKVVGVSTQQTMPRKNQPKISGINFSYLDQLFDLGKDRAENLEFS